MKKRKNIPIIFPGNHLRVIFTHCSTRIFLVIVFVLAGYAQTVNAQLKLPAIPSNTQFSNQYEYNSEYIYRVQLGSEFLEDGAILAYVNGQLRGAQTASVLFPPTGQMVFKIRVFSNEQSGEVISFRYYDVFQERIYEITEEELFSADNVPDYYSPTILSAFCGEPGIATGLLPADQATGLDASVNLYWQPAENTTYYSIYLWKQGDIVPAVPVITNIYGTSRVIHNLEYGATYHWFVLSVNQCMQDTSATHSFTVRDLPDLVVTDVNAPDTVLSATAVTIDLTIENQGTGSTPGKLWYDAVYLSKDNVFTSSDLFMGSIVRKLALAPGENYTQGITVPIPTDYEGEYFLFTKTDYNNAIVETDNNNNNPQGEPIFIQARPLPDVAVRGIGSSSTTMAPGDTIDFSWTVDNTGDAVASGGWTEKVSLVSLSGIRLYLSGTPQYSGTLDQGASVSRNYSFILPEIINFSGEAYIEVEIVPSATLIEYPGDEGNNHATSSNRVVIQSKLYLDIPESARENYNGQIRCTVSRSGNYTESIQVGLSVNLPEQILHPLSVMIPARNTSAVFYISTINNVVLDGDRDIRIDASAPGFSPVSEMLSIQDDEIPTLSLSFDKPIVSEGDTLTLTITRDFANAQVSEVFLSSNASSQLTYINPVIIEGGQLSAIIKVYVTENNIPELNQEVTLTGRSDGLISGTATAMILDDDVPTVEMEILADTVSEGAGPYAAWGIIRRTGSNNSRVRLNLSAGAPNTLYFPAFVALEQNATEIKFNIGVIDNGMVDGFRNVELTGRIYLSSCNCNTTPENGGSVSDNLVIADNDGPSLSVSVNPVSLAEGKTDAGTMTISRNTATTNPLTVKLSSNDDSELSLPSTATIPSGSASVSVSIQTKNDQVEDGSQMVTLQASAAGYSPGTAWVYVTDINRADLEMSDLELSNDTSVTGSLLEVHTTIHNSGYGKAPSGVKVNFYLSKDTKIDEKDSLVHQISLSDPLPAGQAAQVLELITIPEITGDYYLIAKVNPSADVIELLYINNESSPYKLTLLPSYNATAIVDEEIFYEPLPVSIHGQATFLNGNPAPEADLDVYIITGGVRRVIETTTDGSGNYSVLFEPYSFEAGHYSVGACFPGQGLEKEQDAFDILGMELASRKYMNWNIKKNVPVTGIIGLKNRSGVPLTGITFEPQSIPAGFNLSIDTIDNLPGDEIVNFNYTITGTEVTEGLNYLEVPVIIRSAEGIEFKFSLFYYCQALGSNLVSSPASIKTTVTKGKTRYYDLRIYNNGAGETGKVTLELPGLEWMSLASPDSIPNLVSGDTTTFTILLNPSGELPLNTPLTGRIVAHNSNGNDLLIPYHIEIVSEETGSLQVDVVDEYTYFTESAPHVQNAHVVIRHPFNGTKIAEGFTNANGIFEVDSLPEGSYKMTVEAEKHEGYQNVIIVDPGRVNEQSVFLSFQAITYTWEVVPTEIEDSYEVELVMEYETNVPVPVVIMEMPTEMPQLINDETYTFIVTITNKGLITAEDVELKFPEDDPEYEWISTFTKMDLVAQQAIQVPVVMRNRDFFNSGAKSGDSSAGSASKGGEAKCHDYFVTIYGFECGPDRQWRNTSAHFTLSGRICSSGSGAGGDFGWGSLYGGGYGGGGAVYTERPKYYIPYDSDPSTVTPITGCDPCLISVLQTVLGCVAPPPLEALACLYGFADGDVSWSDVGGCIPKYGCVIGVISMFWTCYNNPPPGLRKGVDPAKGSQTQAPPIMAQAVLELEYAEYNNSAERDYVSEYMGLIDWSSKESFKDFTQAVDSIVTNKVPFDAASIAYAKSVMQGSDFTDEEIDLFVSRWNSTMEAWGQGIMIPNIDYPDIINQDSLDLYKARMDTAQNYAYSLGYASVGEMQYRAWHTLKEEAETKRSSVCASVSIKISQKLVMTREAFEGTLTIFNGNTTTAMEQIELNIEIRDENGELKNDLFEIETKALDILTGIDGTGRLGPEEKGSASLIFIPEKGAAPEVPVSYSFGGSFSYLDPFTGVVVTKPLFPVTLEVNPSPDLFLHYFMQRDILGDDPLTNPIEPIVPAELAVMIVNNGYGTAKNVRIESAQPEIVDNEKGLSIHFELIGSNLNGMPVQLGLTDIDFGNIAPKKATIGQWWFTSDLLGHFVNYSASVTHLDSRGNPDISLVSGAELHELIRSIRVYGPTDDGINDFLINDFQDSKEQPDMIYLSQGDLLMDVFGADVGLFEGAIKAPLLTNTLKVIASRIGWNYMVLPDPGQGKYDIVSIMRNSDQQNIPLDNAWLTHVTLPDGEEPVYENRFHVVDIFEDIGEQEYTVTWKLKDPQPPAVFTITGAPLTFVSQQVTMLNVKFNKEINPATFTYEDLTLRLQGGDDIMDSTVVITQLDALTYSLDLSALTTGDGFYVLTVQAAEIEDLGGTKGKTGKQASWTQFIGVPVVEEFIGLPSGNVGSAFDYMLVRFNLPVDVNTVVPARFIISRDGSIVGNPVAVIQMDTESRLFKISGMESHMDTDGEYGLTVDLANIATIDGVKGLSEQAVQWTIDHIPPAVVLFTKSTTGGFDEQHVTSVQIMFSEEVQGFDIASVELWLDNTRQPLSQLKLDSLNGTVRKLSQFRLLTYYPGTYTLKVNMNTVYDRAGISGSGMQEFTWTVKRLPPNKVENLRITPDLGFSATDGITSNRSLTVIMDVPDSGVKIEVYKNDFGTLTLLADSAGVAAGELRIPVLVTSPGNVLLEIHAVDDNEYFSITTLPLFIDEAAFQFSFGNVPQDPDIIHPDMISLVFSEKVLETSMVMDRISFLQNGNAMDISTLILKKVSDTLFTLSGFNSLSAQQGEYTLLVDLRDVEKYVSGAKGTYVARASWTLRRENNAPLADAGDDFNIYPGIAYWLDGSGSSDVDNDFLSYQWFPPQGIVLDDAYIVNPGFTAPAFTGTIEYAFTLVVSDGMLTSSDMVTLFLQDDSNVESTLQKGQVRVYPNPSTDFFIVSVNEIDVESIELIDLAGKIFLRRLWTGGDEQVIKTSQVTPGIYFIRINTRDEQFMKKLILY